MAGPCRRPLAIAGHGQDYRDRDNRDTINLDKGMAADSELPPEEA